MDEIKHLQKVLLLVRRSVGWTAEEFGERIGVTRQTINNLDETEMLRFILDAFVDHPENYSKDDKEKILSKANLLAPAILAGTSSRKDVSKEWLTVTTSIGVITGAMVAGLIGIGLGVTSEWLSKLLSED